MGGTRDRDPADRRVHVGGGSIGSNVTPRYDAARRDAADRDPSIHRQRQSGSAELILGRGVGAVPVLPPSNALLVQRQADGGRRWGTASGPRHRISGRFRRRLDVDVPPEAGAPLRASVRGHADHCARCRSRPERDARVEADDYTSTTPPSADSTTTRPGMPIRSPDSRRPMIGRSSSASKSDGRPRVPVRDARDSPHPGGSRRGPRRGLREVPRRLRAVHDRGVGGARLLGPTGRTRACGRVRTGRATPRTASCRSRARSSWSGTPLGTRTPTDFAPPMWIGSRSRKWASRERRSPDVSTRPGGLRVRCAPSLRPVRPVPGRPCVGGSRVRAPEQPLLLGDDEPRRSAVRRRPRPPRRGSGDRQGGARRAALGAAVRSVR